MFSTHQKKELGLLLLKLFLVVINTCIFRWIWFRLYAENLYIPFVTKGHIAVVLVFMAVYSLLARMYGGFDLKTTRAFLVFYSNVVASVMTGFVMFIVIFLIDNRPGQRTIVVPILFTAELIGGSIAMIKVGWDFIIWALPIELCFIIVSSVFFNKYSYKLDFIIRKIKENRKK